MKIQKKKFQGLSKYLWQRVLEVKAVSLKALSRVCNMDMFECGGHLASVPLVALPTLKCPPKNADVPLLRAGAPPRWRTAHITRPLGYGEASFFEGLWRWGVGVCVFKGGFSEGKWLVFKLLWNLGWLFSGVECVGFLPNVEVECL